MKPFFTAKQNEPLETGLETCLKHDLRLKLILDFTHDFVLILIFDLTLHLRLNK